MDFLYRISRQAVRKPLTGSPVHLTVHFKVAHLQRELLTRNPNLQKETYRRIKKMAVA